MMTPEQERALLDITALGIRKELDEAYVKFLKLLDRGVAPRDAVKQVMDSFTGKYAELLSTGFSAILSRSVGSSSVQAMEVAGVALSEKLYREAAVVSEIVAGIIEDHIDGWHDVRKLALELYEGYGFRAEEVLRVTPRNRLLPKYLREELLVDASIRGDLARHFANIQASRLRTPNLKAAYMEYLDAIEKGRGKKLLQRRLSVVFHERMRYFANRIAQTELHRSYVYRQARELMDDKDVVWVQYRLGPGHPKTDICDLWAQQNRYGLGPGVYPKEECPVSPQHPYCRCVISPRLDIPATAKARLNKNSEREYLRSLDKKDAALVMGGQVKRDLVLSGKSAVTVWNMNKDPLYRTQTVGEIVRRGLVGVGEEMSTIKRASWAGNEVVDIVAPISKIKNHPSYDAAKTGDFNSAAKLVMDLIDDRWIDEFGPGIVAASPILVGVHAVEGVSVNKIGAAMDEWLSLRLNLQKAEGIVQINRVGHTGSSGWHRLSSQAVFDGEVKHGATYWLLDDFIGQGGTLANLRGYIVSQGGRVAGYTALTGRSDSAMLGLTPQTLSRLREKHGKLEEWWKHRFGFGFEALTESEARYLYRAEDADTIRNRMAEVRSEKD